MYILALVVAFFLEIVAFVSFASFVYLFSLSNVVRISLFILLLVLLIIFWSFFMAPKASKKFKLPQYYFAKSIIYIISAFTIFGAKGFMWSILFVAVVVIDELFLYKHNLYS